MLALLFCCYCCCCSYSNVRVFGIARLGMHCTSTIVLERRISLYSQEGFTRTCRAISRVSRFVSRPWAIFDFLQGTLPYSHSSTSTSLRELFVEGDLPSIRSGG